MIRLEGTLCNLTELNGANGRKQVLEEKMYLTSAGTTACIRQI